MGERGDETEEARSGSRSQGEQASALKERLAAEMREAMKARQAVRLSALRLLAASVKNREVELLHPLSDQEFVEVAGREVKRRKEAVEAYEAAGREDRAAREREEQSVLETYLPEALGDREIDGLIEEAIAATGATGPSDLGKVMGQVMAKARGRADGKLIQARVRERLTPRGS
ncbi:MAG: GatB/YqeY domain-containing protein [Actinomycetota bacterium]